MFRKESVEWIFNSFVSVFWTLRKVGKCKLLSISFVLKIIPSFLCLTPLQEIFFTSHKKRALTCASALP